MLEKSFDQHKKHKSHSISENKIDVGFLTKLLHPTTIPEELENTVTQSELVDMIHANLIQLLNTRQQPNDLTNHLDNITTSIYNYGLPDLSIFNPDSQTDRESVRKILQTTIELFEPRLENVSVATVLPKKHLMTEVLSFRIIANLSKAKFSAPVSFDSVINPSSDYIIIHPTHR